ncbi:MAG TPA: hypothetical protein VJ767_11295 [Nitrososphaeraceae archaeon]|nr:hypothetical protein [Nitrososphaeraceae archaeon]
MDDSIYFISLVKQTELELKFATKYFPSNVTLSLDHLDELIPKLTDLYYFNDAFVDDQDFIDRYNKDVYSTNTTTHALVVSTLVDILLNKYAASINLNFDLTNMSNLLVFVNSTELKDTVKGNIYETGYKPSDTKINISERDYKLLFSKNNVIIDHSDYLVARELSKEVNTIFYLYLKSFEGLNKENINNVLRLENNLQTLNVMVENKESPSEIMKLVHLEIHPTMQKIYSLKINQTK